MQKLLGLLLLVVRKYQLAQFVLVSLETFFFFFFFFMCFLFVPGNDVRNWLWVYVSYFYFNAREVGP